VRRATNPDFDVDFGDFRRDMALKKLRFQPNFLTGCTNVGLLLFFIAQQRELLGYDCVKKNILEQMQQELSVKLYSIDLLFRVQIFFSNFPLKSASNWP
jgi:hypothetical protein